MPGAAGSDYIVMDWTDTVGETTGHLLPTGRAADRIRLESGVTVAVTICDVGNLACWVDGRGLGLDCSESVVSLENDVQLMRTVFEVRGKAAVLAGLVHDWRMAAGPDRGLPLTGCVAPARAFDAGGEHYDQTRVDLLARLVFQGEVRQGLAGSAAMGLAACSQVAGSVVHSICGKVPGSTTLRIGHPTGVLSSLVTAEADGAGPLPRFSRLAMLTPRRLDLAS